MLDQGHHYRAAEGGFYHGIRHRAYALAHAHTQFTREWNADFVVLVSDFAHYRATLSHSGSVLLD